ncbi:unnamed protein product, partial [Ixodes hexagonus]
WLSRHLQSLSRGYAQDETRDDPVEWNKYGRNITRRTLDISRRVCNLKINIDHTLYSKMYETEQDHMKAHASLKSLVFRHVNRASQVYRKTNFGGIEDISFAVQHIRINDSTHCIGEKLNTNPFCSTTIDSAYMLHLASKSNHDDFCLSYAWTYRDFADGILGLAWMARHNGENETALSRTSCVLLLVGPKYSALISNILFQVRTIADSVSYNTAAVAVLYAQHRIGGAHDNDSTCAPDGEVGNYIMFPAATSGTKPNNHKFSSCSKGNISTVLVPLFEGTSSRENCFQGE